jgi:hypothetical protein
MSSDQKPQPEPKPTTPKKPKPIKMPTNSELVGFKGRY